MIQKTLALALALSLLTGCVDNTQMVPVVVGGKTSTEGRVLAEILAQTIESHGMRVDRIVDIGQSEECHLAIRSGRIDLYVEYTGLALAKTLGDKPALEIATLQGEPGVLKRVRDEYADDGLTWTSPLGFNNGYVLVVGPSTTAANASAAVVPARGWRAGFDREARLYLVPPLERVYGFKFVETRNLPEDQKYQALVNRDVDVVSGNMSDAAISRFKLRALEDDKAAFLPFQATPLVRQSALDQNSELGPALESLARQIRLADIQKMNEAVEVQGRTPAEVVTEFIENW